MQLTTKRRNKMIDSGMWHNEQTVYENDLSGYNQKLESVGIAARPCTEDLKTWKSGEYTITTFRDGTPKRCTCGGTKRNPCEHIVDVELGLNELSSYYGWEYR